MKNIQLIFIILFLCGVSYAQDKKNTFTLDDGCGDPAVESQTYGFWKAKVVKIKSSNQIILDYPKNRGLFKIKLVGINPRENKTEIVNFLKKNVLNQEVWATSNSPRKFGATVQVLNNGEIDDLNEYLIENGIAKYVDFDSANLVPFYMPCRLQKAENRAKLAKRGIWAK